MASIDFNDLLNPVGMVHHKNKGRYGISEREYDVSADNPAYKLINSMIDSGKFNKDNMGDLYDKGLQWEIDRSTWIDQLEVDQAIKAEQREYDSDVQKAKRAREAGINMDLGDGSVSGSGSGSSGNSVGASTLDNVGGVGNTDNYAGRNYALNAIQTAGQFINDVSASVNNIMNGISQLRTANSAVKLHDAQANLVNAQADEVNALIDGKVEMLNSSNIGAFMDNSRMFSGMLGKDFTDEQAAAIYAAAGIPEEMYGGYNSAVRAIHERPEVASSWYGNKVRERYTRAQNQTYTEDYVSQYVSRQAEIETDSQISQMYITLMDRKLNEILNYDPSYIDNKAGAILDSTAMSADQVEQAYTEFKNYCYSYGERLDYAKEKIAQIDKEITPYVNFDSNGNIVSIKDDISPAERAFVDAAMDSRMLIKYGAANDFMLFSNSINRFGMMNYIKNEMIKDKTGNLKTLNGRQKVVQFGEGMFRETISGVRSGMDVASQAVGMVAGLVGSIGTAGIGGAAIMGGLSALRKTNALLNSNNYSFDANSVMQQDRQRTDDIMSLF